MSNNLRIAVSGKSGCGNTSVSRLVADRLGLRLINYTFHNYAEELKIPFAELLSRAVADPSYDLDLDRKQLELARQGNCVLGSRLAIWLLKEATLKVYLHASPQTRAERLSRREGKDVARALQDDIRDRDENDHRRFLKLYGIDNDDYGFADLVLDTEQGDQYRMAEIIIADLSRRGLLPPS